jgi:hypothetical protein
MVHYGSTGLSEANPFDIYDPNWSENAGIV